MTLTQIAFLVCAILVGAIKAQIVVPIYVSNDANCNATASNGDGLYSPTLPYCDIATPLGQLNLMNPVGGLIIRILLMGNNPQGHALSNIVTVSNGYSSLVFAPYNSLNATIRCTQPVAGFTITNANYDIQFTDVTIADCRSFLTASWDSTMPPAMSMTFSKCTLYNHGDSSMILGATNPTAGVYTGSVKLTDTKILNCSGQFVWSVGQVQILNSALSNNYYVSTAPFHLEMLGTDSAVYFENSTFTHNEVVYGDFSGPILISIAGQSGNVTIVNSTFVNNRGISGGAIYLEANGTATISVRDSTFDSNNAEMNGGAFYMSANISVGSVVIDNCIFTNNVASTGAALYYNSMDISGFMPYTVTSSVFRQNTATMFAGAMWFRATNITLIKCYITQNTSPSSTIQITNSSGIISNSVISSNVLQAGSAISATSLNALLCNLSIVGTTISSNYGGDAVDVSGAGMQAYVSGSYLWGNSGFALSCSASLSFIDASFQNSIYGNGWDVTTNIGQDVFCSSCSIILPGGQDNCSSCNAGVTRDVCSICNGASSCLSPGCSVPYSSCAPATIANAQSDITISYSSVNPTLQTASNNNDLVTLDFISLADIASDGAITTNLFSDGTFLQNDVVTTKGTTLISFDGQLLNGAKVTLQQVLYGSATDVTYAGAQFSVSSNTLKITIGIANWPTSNNVSLTFLVKHRSKVLSVDTINRQDIIDDTTIRSKDTTTLLALSNVYVSFGSSGSATNFLATARFIQEGQNVRVIIDFQGPIGTLLYDPDIGALLEDNGDGDGDGGDSSQLIAILVPVLVGGACVGVCLLIIIFIIGTAGVAWYQRRKPVDFANQSDSVNFTI